jgi:hypothetical protein
VKVIAVKMMSLLEPEDLVVVVCDEKAEVVRFLPWGKEEEGVYTL